MTTESGPNATTRDERVQIAFELIGLVPVNGEHPDDFELTLADRERLLTCSCAHCEPGDGICPMTVQGMIGDYLSQRDDDLAEALADRLTIPRPGEARVEWGHRYPDGSVLADSSEQVAYSRAVISRMHGDKVLVLVRRTVTDWQDVDA